MYIYRELEYAVTLTGVKLGFTSRWHRCLFMASVECYKSLDSMGHCVWGQGHAECCATARINRWILDSIKVMRLMKGQTSVINPLHTTPVVIVPPLTSFPK